MSGSDSGSPRTGPLRPPAPAPLAPLARKKLVIEALLLALRNSEIARVVDIGTLNYFLDSSYPDMARANTFHLSTLFAVLAKEPGVEASMIYPPLLAFKRWEKELGVQVVLPQAMLLLGPEERAAHEARCPVAAADLDRLLRARRPAPVAPPTAPLRKGGTALRRPTALAQLLSRVRHDLHAGAVALAVVVGFGLLLLGLWLAFRPAQAPRFDVSQLQAAIPLKDGRRSSAAMSAIIADPHFATLPREERQRLAAETFARAKEIGVQSMLLYDASGALVVAASTGATDRITVRP